MYLAFFISVYVSVHVLHLYVIKMDLTNALNNFSYDFPFVLSFRIHEFFNLFDSALGSSFRPSVSFQSPRREPAFRTKQKQKTSRIKRDSKISL